MSLLDLSEKVKNLFSGAKQFVQQNPTPVGFAIQPLQQYLQNVGQNNPRVTKFTLKAERPVQQVSSFMQNMYNPVQLPTAKVQAPPYATPFQKLPASIGAGAYNYVAKPLLEGLANAPRNIVGGFTKTGLGLRDISQGKQGAYKQTLGAIGQTGKGILDASVLPFGASAAKNIGTNALQTGFRGAVSQGMRQGMKFGGSYGLLSGLENNKDVKSLSKYLEGVGSEAGIGAVAGGAFGGVVGAGSYAVGSVLGKMGNALKSKGMKDKDIRSAITQFARDEAGRFAKQEYIPKKKEPIFYGDLRESIGLKRNGDYIPSPGMTVRPISSKPQALTGVRISSSKGMSKGKGQSVGQTGSLLSEQPQLNGKPIPTTAIQEVSSAPIIPEKGKLNINRLNISDEGKQVLQANEAQVKSTVIGNKKVVAAADLAKGRKNPLTDDQMKNMMAQQLKSRQQVVDLTKQFTQAKQSGASEQELAKIMLNIADQSETARQGGTLAGRLLQAQNIIADESASPMQKIFALLDNAGVDKTKYVKDAVGVNWDNPAEVVKFYRSFVHPKFGEVLDEIRYSNMLSSPLTHITNIASNAIQTGVVAPIEKTISGVLDFGKTALTGKERQYYASAGLQYTGGYVKSLPQAFKKAWNVMSGKEVTIRPDFEYIPTGVGGPLKAYTTPLRALEAMDQFFKTLVEGGVTKELQSGPRKLSNIQISDTAGKEATYRLFREKFDPNGELGQGGMLKLWDKWNSGIQSLRRLPGGKWILPFLQTPTNILKQGIEFSPLGVATIPGAKRPIEQLSKTIIGTGVFMGAYQLGQNGLLSWATPTGEKEKALYYDAGLQPYSVKIGDKWVSFSKLGPLSYPIALAAALSDAEKKNPDSRIMSNVGQAMGGLLGFFGDQSYVRSIGDLVEAVQSGGNIKKSAVSSEAANLVGQLVPYKSFLTWVGRILDPVYRKAGTFGEKMMRDMPGLSPQLDPYTNLQGQPSQKDFPLLNAVSPYRVSQEKPGEQMYRKFENTKIQKDQVKRAEESVTKGNDTMIGETFVYWDDKTREAKSIDMSFQPTKPELTGLAELDKKSISKFNGEITKKANDIYDLYKAGKLTQDEANTQLNDLKTLKASVGGSGSAKKITAKKISPKVFKIAMPKKSKITNIKISAPPKPKASKSKSIKITAGKPIKAKKLYGLQKSVKLV